MSLLQTVLVSLIALDGTVKSGKTAVVYPEPLYACVVSVVSEPSATTTTGVEYYWRYNCELDNGTWVEFDRRRIQKI